MSELTRHRPVLEPVPSPSAPPSTFIHENGHFSEPEEDSAVPAAQVLNIMQRYEDRLDGLVNRVTGQATEVATLTKSLEAERRAAMSARHRLEISQLDSRQRVEEIQNRAEQTRLRASVEVEKQRHVAELAQHDLKRTVTSLDSVSAQLEICDELRSTPWHAFKKRRALVAELAAYRKRS